jgi:hypothetical protein
MKKNSPPKSPTKVITGENTRFSYCYVWEPTSNFRGDPQYSVSLLIPKSDKVTVGKINAAIEAAYHKGEAKLRDEDGLPPLSKLRTPLRDGDTDRPKDPAYAGCWFLNANSTKPVGIVDAACSPILDRSEFYSGCYGRASVTFFAYNVKGNRGIACGLNNLQKLRDGERLGNYTSAEEEFTGLDDDEELLS